MEALTKLTALLFLVLLLACSGSNTRESYDISAAEQAGELSGTSQPGGTTFFPVKSAELVNDVNGEPSSENSEMFTLSNYLSSERENGQKFLLTEGEQTVTCEQGTIIRLNTADFVYEDGTPVNGSIELRVEEYYSMADIVLAGLTTTSKDRLLESGGMVNVEAFCSERKCDLKKGKTIGISFPTMDYKYGMMAFSGEETGSMIDWLLQPGQNADFGLSTLSGLTSKKPIIVIICADGTIRVEGTKQKKYLSYLNKYAGYSLTALNRELDGIVRVTREINETKNRSRLLYTGYSDNELALIADYLLKDMPRPDPYFVEGRTVYSDQHFIFRFSMNTDSVSPEVLKRAEIIESATPNQTIILPPGYDYFVGENKVLNEFDEEFNGGKKMYNMSQVTYYALSSSTLGWINCDRFINTNNENMNLTVDAGSRFNTSVMIIFSDFKSCMSGRNLNMAGFYTINGVPSGMNVIVVGIKIDDDQLYLSMVPMKSGEKSSVKLVYSPISKKGLKEALSIFGNPSV